ncbi:MAG TPA: hypothetical protein PLL01_17880, partial [Rhodoferax sp.]|nr:hypothetical protein [Rhodoferax sp.]
MMINDLGSAYAGRPSTPNSLAFLWRKYTKQKNVSEVYITSQNLGQLKHFIRVVGSDAETVMTFVLKHWHEFNMKVSYANNYESTSSGPNIGFLSKHADVAKKMYEDKHCGGSDHQNATQNPLAPSKSMSMSNFGNQSLAETLA